MAWQLRNTKTFAFWYFVNCKWFQMYWISKLNETIHLKGQNKSLTVVKFVVNKFWHKYIFSIFGSWLYKKSYTHSGLIWKKTVLMKDIYLMFDFSAHFNSIAHYPIYWNSKYSPSSRYQSLKVTVNMQKKKYFA